MLYLILNPKTYETKQVYDHQKYSKLLAGTGIGKEKKLLQGVPQQGTQAYLVSVAGARNIVRLIKEEGGMRDAIDMTYHRWTKERKLNVYSVTKDNGLVANDGGTHERQGQATELSTISGSPTVQSLYGHADL